MSDRIGPMPDSRNDERIKIRLFGDAADDSISYLDNLTQYSTSGLTKIICFGNCVIRCDSYPSRSSDHNTRFIRS